MTPPVLSARPGRATRTTRARRRSDDRASYLWFLIPGAVLLLAVIVVPLFMNVGISLTRWSGVGDPQWTGLDNYRRLFADGTFWASFRHNVNLIVAMALLPTLAGLVIAAALYDFVGKRFGPRAASVLRACIYLPQVLPIAVAGIVWGWILAPDNGALNEFLDAVGLGALAQDWLGDPDLALWSVMGVLVWVQVGYPVVIFMAGLQRVDPALYEAAELDGASWWRRFWHISIPQIRAEVYVVLLTCTIAALKVFGPIYVLTRGGPGGSTNVPSYFSFQNFFEKTQVGYGAAIATVLMVIILVLTAVFLRAQDRGESTRR
ncbi:carbohydrate ABC transporter permease [Goodfellowiella coeruleoviolacea]|uniref:Carbohydrate ABC transporter membrane protein 1, CUT1 family (TC 3.A.1.1.-) n=1 Tax=Goodfellowiella coeruleoviolacea TaxID=334858 RepID=A0AAE3KEL9_9PSEU|nr:sugar ABC transporter permease [Goodfellowiella coeruleoviolacea]MCP2163985.1 carbohydrate ABC transporter membrane protein 1, CUT1 family (TC 3.A.1.1.-) [Goodfellowiella coeruleoviolacea]